MCPDIRKIEVENKEDTYGEEQIHTGEDYPRRWERCLVTEGLKVSIGKIRISSLPD